MDDTCNCCTGLAADTPEVKSNAPGLPAIRYRIGAQPDFMATLTARLSGTDFPALAALTARDGDWTWALCDALACLADVLTFYQERIANESYLRTATERRSVLEMANLIGYRPSPGVAAGTALAFTLDTPPGQPPQWMQPVSIPSGTRVQSIPDQGQAPQNFETVADIVARASWNAIPVRQSETVQIASGLKELYIAGAANQIQPGDAILIVGSERDQATANQPGERWDVRWLDRVEPDLGRGVTRLTWLHPLGKSIFTSPAAQGVRIYVFRQRASLFGHNAPDPRLIFTQNNPDNHSVWDGSKYWNNFGVGADGHVIDLDASYPKIVPGSWVALAGPNETHPHYVELYRVSQVAQASRTDFAVTAKITRITPDTTVNLDANHFDRRTTAVLAQSEELAFAPRPLTYPLFGDAIVLGSREPDLVSGQLIAVSGKRQRVAVPVDTTGISFPDATSPRSPQPGESFVLLGPVETQTTPNTWVTASPSGLDAGAIDDGAWRWTVLDHDGQTTRIVTPAKHGLLLQPALKTDPDVSETATIANTTADSPDLESTTLNLSKNLANCYDRATVTINANVAPATHGETVSEIAGSGDATIPNQKFRLKQSPLTYVADSTNPSGGSATLEVRVNDLKWSERRTLYGASAKERGYTLSRGDDEVSTIAFGDGIEGLRLPSGQNNIRLKYRKGLGTGGNLRTGQLTTLLTRPPGVKAVTNPSPATGGQDAEPLALARQNAPLRVLTLDRAVAIQDYADFSRSFAGIAKANAIWVDQGSVRGIYVTVAGPDGADIPDGGDTQQNLVAALRNFGDSLLPLRVQSYTKLRFGLTATIKPSAAADPDKTLAAVRAALTAAYAFDAREFGEPVTSDGVYAVIHSVREVEAADIELTCLDPGIYDSQQLPSLLLAALPGVQSDGTVNPAELLTIDPVSLILGVMS